MSRKNKDDWYILVTPEDCHREGYSWLEKNICSFVLGYPRNNQEFFATPRCIADKLGISDKVVYKTFSKMKRDGIFPKVIATPKKRVGNDSLDGESDFLDGESDSLGVENSSLDGETVSLDGEIKSGEMPLKTGAPYTSRYASLKSNLKASSISKPEPAAEAAQANAAQATKVKETAVADPTVNAIKTTQSVSAFDNLVARLVEGEAGTTNSLSSAQPNAASSDKRSESRSSPLPAPQNFPTEKQTTMTPALDDDEDDYFTGTGLRGNIVKFPKRKPVSDSSLPVSATLAKTAPPALIKKTSEKWGAEFDEVFAELKLTE